MLPQKPSQSLPSFLKPFLYPQNGSWSRWLCKEWFLCVTLPCTLGLPGETVVVESLSYGGAQGAKMVLL